MSVLIPARSLFSFVGASLVTPAALDLGIRRAPQVEPLRPFHVLRGRMMHNIRLHLSVGFIALQVSKPPAPLSACVIREVIFYLKMIKRSLPAAPLHSLENLLRNSAGFLCPKWQLLSTLHTVFCTKRWGTTINSFIVVKEAKYYEK